MNTPADTSTTTEVAAFNEALCTNLAAHDVEAVVACFTDDAILLAPGSDIVAGTDALRQWWTDFFASGFGSAELTTEQIIVNQPDLVVEVGRYRMELRPAGGEAVVDRGKYSVVFRRGSDGQLRYAVDALNSSVS